MALNKVWDSFIVLASRSTQVRDLDVGYLWLRS